MKKIFKLIVFLCVATLLTFSVVNVDYNNIEVVASNANTQAKTKQPGRYTKTVEQVFKELQYIRDPESEGFWIHGAKELKKVKAYDNLMASTVDTIFALAENDPNKDTISIWYDLGTSAVNVAASCFGLGSLSNSLLTSLKNMGETQQTEIQVLEEKMNEQFEQVNDRFDEVQRDIQELSNRMDESTEIITGSFNSAFEAQEARLQLIDFYSSRNGEFNYKQFKAYLYGSDEYSDQNYYNKLVYEIGKENQDPEQIKLYYDLLYYYLNSKEGGDSAINILYEYILGDSFVDIKSIQYYYYQYLLYNSIETNHSIEFEALQFALDLYTTALFADHCILMCNNFQMLKLYEKYGNKISADSKYYYGDGPSDFITYEQILNNQEIINKREKALTEKIVKDVISILNLEGSYNIKHNDSIYNVTNYNEDTFGQYILGDEIYLNKLTSEVCSLFDFDVDQFTFKCDNPNVTLNDGVIKCTEELTNSTISYYYEDVKLYSIKFGLNDGSSFAGGSGEYDDPYLINCYEQLDLINTTEDGLSASYLLLNDIDCGNHVLDSIGSKEYPFKGTFEGNDFSIKNATLEQDDYTGLFGYIDYQGSVLNLTIDNFKLDFVSVDETTNNIGVVTSVNEGLIYNVIVNNTHLNLRQDFTVVNKTILTSVGLVAAENLGEILYSSVKNSSINAFVSRNYNAEKDYLNQIVLNIGGITASQLYVGSIENCYVDENTKLSGTCQSFMKDNFSTRHPYVDLNIGGIFATGSFIGVSKVYSDVKIVESDIDVKNTSGVGGTKENNCNFNKSQYFPKVEDKILKNIKVDSIDKIEINNNKKDFNVYFANEYIYSYNEKLNTDDLVVELNGEKISCALVSYYFFDSSNEDKENEKIINVEFVFAAYLDGKLQMFSKTLPLTIDKNQPTELLVLKSPSKVDYNLNEEVNLSGGVIGLVYQDGSYVDVTREVLAENLTYKYGENIINLSYLEFNTKLNVNVECAHSFVDHIVNPTCSSIGFTERKCTICEFTYTVDYLPKLEHEAHVLGERYAEATCANEGYTGDAYCKYCGLLIEKGLVIEKLSHNFDCMDANSHICQDCDIVEMHSFKTIENSSNVLYYCVNCNYSFTEEIVNSNIPHVIVVDAYALPNQDIVEVSIQIVNNPGITGASFNVNYDEKLTYIDFKEGNLLRDSIMLVKNDSVTSSCKVTLGRANVDTTEEGTIVKLSFRLPEETSVNDFFNISLSYSRSASQFSDKNNNALDIITISGSIYIVNHLPGDVDNDSEVDVLDALLIARYLSDYNDEKFNHIYADVNLDGFVTISDLTLLLQYISGDFGAETLSNQYTIFLNTNDGSEEPLKHLVSFYNEQGTRNTYSAIESLPVLRREGYSFLGWYTEFDGGELITNETLVTYNNKQRKQTLYARWELNEVIYDGNGATAGTMESQTFYSNNEYIVLNNSFERMYQINYYMYNYQNQTQTVKYRFLGWSTTPNGSVEYVENAVINLKDSGIGTLKLYAVWEKENFNLLSNLTKFGYEFSGWTTDSTRTNKDLPFNDEFEFESDLNLYDLWSPIYYHILYLPNGGSGTTEDNVDLVRSAENKQKLAVNKFERPGYNFVEWNTKADGSGTGYQSQEEVGYIAGDENNLVKLYAIWEGKEYNIHFDACDGSTSQNAISVKYNEVIGYLPTASRNGYTFTGWYTDEIGGTLVNESTIYKNVSSITLYAHYSAKQYKISYNANNGKGTMSTSTHTYDVAKKLNTNAFSKFGYYFAGWSTNKNATVPTYTDGENVTNVSLIGNDITLYAVWYVTFSTSRNWSDSYTVGWTSLFERGSCWILYFNTKASFDYTALKNNGYTSATITFTFTIDANSGHSVEANYKLVSGTGDSNNAVLPNQKVIKTASHTLSKGAAYTTTITANISIADFIARTYVGVYFSADGVNSFDAAENKYVVKNCTATVIFQK